MAWGRPDARTMHYARFRSLSHISSLLQDGADRGALAEGALHMNTWTTAK